MPPQESTARDTDDAAAPCEIAFEQRSEDTLIAVLTGNWTIARPVPEVEAIEHRLESLGMIRRLSFDTGRLAAWDSALLAFLIKLLEFCKRRGITVDRQGLPEGVRSLLAMAAAVPERRGARRQAVREPLLARIGAAALGLGASAKEFLEFIGEATIAFGHLLAGKARFRASDLTLLIQQCGAEALGIVTLISVLVGLILAFVGAVQLRMFGAQIYVADLVGLGMAREMGAMMAAIIMAGRTGAAYAAQLGTMQVNEEIDALQTLGISPMEFLVLPRMIALILMLPLLCLYADFMGILGGAVVGIGLLDITPAQYYFQTQAALSLTHFAVGVFKAGVFGVLVAVSGCLRGIQCGRSASAVGDAATSAVVTGIVLIVVFDAVLTVIYDILGI